MASAARVSNMSPDRGFSPPPASVTSSSDDAGYLPSGGPECAPSASVLDRSPPVPGRSFTVRGVAVGLLVGLVICFSNMYFGLQTGWVSTMTMPASLMGFGIFKTLSRRLKFPFSPVENVLVQTVAGSMAIMPLGCGFVGVVSIRARPVVRSLTLLIHVYVDPCNELFAFAGRARTSTAQPLEANRVVARALLFWRCIRRSIVCLPLLTFSCLI